MSFQADTQMQHPGRVSFKFIDKMQLVSDFLLGTVRDREQGWLVHGRRCPDPQSPLSPPFAETAQEGPILLGQGASKSQFGHPVGL